MKLCEVKTVDRQDERHYFDFYGYVDFMNTREAQRILSKVDVLDTIIREEGGEDFEDVMRSMVLMTEPDVKKIDQMFNSLNQHMISKNPTHPRGSYSGYAQLSALDTVGRIDV